MSAIATVGAVILDLALGEPRRAHPLVAFGRLARGIEARLHGDHRAAGVLAWIVAVVPLTLVVGGAAVAIGRLSPALQLLASAGVLYAALGWRSLREHALPVAEALEGDRLDEARAAVGRIVSRDTAALDASQVATAATESVLENGNDAVFGALFWFVVLGAPGAVLYRLANTLDAMWGYRSPRYERFGWAAARIDDALNWIPARLTAATYALLGDRARAWRCWQAQARTWDSPNAGPVMAAGAGAIGVQLGGAAPYDGRWEPRPSLGEGGKADAGSIRRALSLVDRGVLAWIVVALVGSAVVSAIEPRLAAIAWRLP